MKENLHFKYSQLIYINNQKQNQKKKKKKQHIRLVTVSVGVDLVAKTDYEVYVLSIIKIYSFHLFSLLC